MSEIRRKRLNIASWTLLILSAIVALGFATHTQNNMVCDAIEIDVDISNNMHFLSNADIMQVMLEKGVQAQGLVVKDIDLASIEDVILDIPSVEKAAVYTTGSGKLRIDVVQRTPVVRIFNRDGSSFYLDVNGVPMPLSMNYTARALPVTGVPNNGAQYSVDDLNRDDSLKEASLLDDIYVLSNYIEQDEFLKALIVQVNVNEDKEFELTPRVGGQKILFGRTEDPAPRFNKLKLFYEKGLRKSDQRKYSTLDLRFEDQIVCTKKNIY